MTASLIVPLVVVLPLVSAVCFLLRKNITSLACWL